MSRHHRYAEYRVSPLLYPWLWARQWFRRSGRAEHWPDDGVDYTGWRARWLRDAGPLRAGAEGTVTGFQTVAQGKQWTIAYATETIERLDVLTHLPSPESVELIEPAA